MLHTMYTFIKGFLVSPPCCIKSEHLLNEEVEEEDEDEPWLWSSHCQLSPFSLFSPVIPLLEVLKHFFLEVFFSFISLYWSLQALLCKSWQSRDVATPLQSPVFTVAWRSLLSPVPRFSRHSIWGHVTFVGDMIGFPVAFCFCRLH